MPKINNTSFDIIFPYTVAFRNTFKSLKDKYYKFNINYYSKSLGEKKKKYATINNLQKILRYIFKIIK